MTSQTGTRPALGPTLPLFTMSHTPSGYISSDHPDDRPHTQTLRPASSQDITARILLSLQHTAEDVSTTSTRLISDGIESNKPRMRLTESCLFHSLPRSGPRALTCAHPWPPSRPMRARRWSHLCPCTRNDPKSVRISNAPSRSRSLAQAQMESTQGKRMSMRRHTHAWLERRNAEHRNEPQLGPRTYHMLPTSLMRSAAVRTAQHLWTMSDNKSSSANNTANSTAPTPNVSCVARAVYVGLCNPVRLGHGLCCSVELEAAVGWRRRRRPARGRRRGLSLQ